MSLIAQDTPLTGISLQDEWLVYNWENEVYSPFIQEVYSSKNSLTLLVDTYVYSNKKLYLSHNSISLDVFINNKLFYNVTPNKPLIITVETLSELVNDSLIIISVHSDKNFKILPNIYLTEGVTVNYSTYHYEEHFEVVSREKALYERGRLLILIFGFITFISIVHSPINPILRLITIEGIRSLFFDTKINLSSKLSTYNILMFILLISLVFSLSIFVLNIRSDVVETIINVFSDFFEFLPFGKRIVIIYLFFFCVFVLKLMLISITGLLFNLKNEINTHTYEFVSLSQVFVLLLFGLLISHGFYPQVIDSHIVVGFMSYGVLIVSILVAFKVNGIITFKNVFIISYFCITEFIPALIMFRLF